MRKETRNCEWCGTPTQGEDLVTSKEDAPYYRLIIGARLSERDGASIDRIGSLHSPYIYVFRVEDAREKESALRRKRYVALIGPSR